MAKLEMRRFKVEILVVPPQHEILLFGAKQERRTVEIEGYTLKDAKRRAGIK